MVNKTISVEGQSLPDVGLNSREGRQSGCVGCHSRCIDFAGQSRQKFGEDDPDLSLLAKAIIHTVGIPVVSATTLVGSAAVAGFGDGTQLVVSVLGLAIGASVCRPLSFKAH